MASADLALWTLEVHPPALMQTRIYPAPAPLPGMLIVVFPMSIARRTSVRDRTSIAAPADASDVATQRGAVSRRFSPSTRPACAASLTHKHLKSDIRGDA